MALTEDSTGDDYAGMECPGACYRQSSSVYLPFDPWGPREQSADPGYARAAMLDSVRLHLRKRARA
jgi:hypothetical protein